MEIQGDFAGGWLLRHAGFQSGLVPPRNIDIWLPPGYDERPDLRWPVVYMHDGQNLFDTGTAFTGVDWGVDEAVAGLMQTGQIQGAIVVGLWNTGFRYQEYAPQRAFEEGLPGPHGHLFQTYAAE